MSYLPIFHPLIEADVRGAMANYETRSSGLGRRFKHAFYDAVDAILVLPLKDAVKIDGETRTRLMRPFPYLIFYVVERSTVFVLTVQYAGRSPAILKSIARGRESI